jgi:hypothetical protein
MIARRREAFALPLAIGAGLAIALLDSRPGWDATGVTAILLVLAAFVSAALAGRHPWLWALLVGGWILLLEIPSSGQPGPAIALLFSATGALAGYGLARLVREPSQG